VGLSVHRQSRSTRLAKRLDAWRNGTAGSTIKQVWISLRCSPPLSLGGLQGVEPKLFFRHGRVFLAKHRPSLSLENSKIPDEAATATIKAWQGVKCSQV